MFEILANFDVFNWLIMPLLIFFARVIDVSMGTIRVVLVSKGYKNIAPFIGFFEVLIWLSIISRIMNSIDNTIWMIAYASGFATGTYVGILISGKLSDGKFMIRIISDNPQNLLETLKRNGFRITCVKSFNNEMEKSMIISTIIYSHHIKKVVGIIRKYDNSAFYSIEEVKAVNEKIFPKKRKNQLIKKIINGGYSRKGK